MKKVVVHPGRSHRDDFLSVCVLLAEYDSLVVERREPTREDLDDLSVFVVDVGDEHDPSKANFDHHQDIGLPCAFHLVMKHLGYHELASQTYGWYELTSRMDVDGPHRVAAEEGLSPELLLSTNSPVEFFMLGKFSEISVMDSSHYLYSLMQELGEGLVSSLDRIHERFELLKSEAQIVDLGEILAIVHNIEENPAMAMEMFRRSLNDSRIAVSVSPSDRGNGWAFYRYADHPSVDFTKISSCDPVSFAHRGGFLAKTATKIPIPAALELVKMAIVA